MPACPLTRNLTDGQLVLMDGSGTPKTCTVTLDEGNLSWTENDLAREVMDRGVLDHVREGNEQSCDITWTLKWVELISFTASASAGNVGYEMINNIGSSYTTTGCTGGKFSLKHVFTVVDPSGVENEVVTFAKVYKASLQCGEGDEFNTIAFSGKDFEKRPTIAKV